MQMTFIIKPTSLLGYCKKIFTCTNLASKFLTPKRTNTLYAHGFFTANPAMILKNAILAS